MAKKIVVPMDRESFTRRLSGVEVGMAWHEITCKACRKVQGYCLATNGTLRDWDEFHYTQRNDGKKWHGCMTPHVSPITSQLCLECCCGQDTRDFRANVTLPLRIAIGIEEKNRVGREFGRFGSKFLTKAVKRDTIFSGGKKWLKQLLWL